MKKLILTIVILCGAFLSNAQSSNDLATITARICQTDSVIKVLGVYNEDSILVFTYMTPDYDTYGATSYEYENFDLVFDASSNLLFDSRPYGKIDFVEFGKKKARVVIELAKAGDRAKQGLWTFAVYDFEKPKGAQWMLQGIEYYYDDYFSGKELK